MVGGFTVRIRVGTVLLISALIVVPGLCQVTQPKPEDVVCTVQGTVLAADSGKPLKSAQVRLNESDAKSPHSYRASTDGDGRFSIKNITPGRYRFFSSKNGYVSQQYRPENSVSAALLTLSPAQNLDRVLFRMTPAAVIAGRITDDDGEPLSGIGVMAMVRAKADLGMVWGNGSQKQLIPIGRAVTNDLGEYRLFGLRAGKYFLVADDAGEDAVWSATGETGVRPVRRYPPTFYPGTLLPPQAEQVQVKATEEIRIDFTLQPTKLFDIKGKVVAAGGAASGASWIVLQQPESVLQQFLAQHDASVDSEGSFSITGVAPGSYDLIANSNDHERQMSARQKIEITDHDLSDIRVVLTKGATVSGRIATDDGQPLPPNAAQFVMLGSRSNEWAANHGDQVKADGTFSISGIRPGEFRVQVFRLPDGWYIRSLRFGDQDVTDAPLKIEQGTGAMSLDIRIANDAGRIEGAVQLKDKSAAGATVLVLRENSFDAEPQSMKADQNGMYVARNLRPGTYHVMAVQRDEEDFETDLPEAAEIEKNGETVQLGPRGAKSLTLKLASKPDQNVGNEPRQ
jgi:protocatechuate 3,4-dioxygenase beta subunit